MAMPLYFVGRTVELARMRQAAARVRDGQPWTVVLEGEAGIGKTSLLLRAVSELADFLILRASGAETARHEPYGVIRQLVTRLPETGGVRGCHEGPDRAPSTVGGQLMRACIGLGRPVALVLDDVQWIDRESAAALRFMLRQLANDRVLVLAAYRPAPSSDAGAELADALCATGGRHTYLSLLGLTDTEISELARSLRDRVLPAATVARIATATGGHPLYVQTLLAEAPTGWVDRLDARPPVPGSLAVLLRARLARLPRASRDLVGALAVLDSRAPLSLVGRLAGLTAPVAAYPPAVDAGLVEPVEAGWIALRHPLVQAAVYEALPPPLRRRLHAAAADLVEGGAALRHRVAAASRPDEPLAAEVERAADSSARRGAHTLAGEQLLQASALSETAAERQRRLLIACVELLEAFEYRRVLPLRAEVERCPPSPLRRYVLAHLLPPTPESTPDYIAHHHDVIAAEPAGRERDVSARAALSLARLYCFAGRAEDAVRHTGQALALATDRHLVLRTRSVRAWATGLAEGPAAGLASLSDLADTAAASTAGTELLITRGILRMHLGDFADARHDLTTAASRPNGSATLFWWLGHYHLVLLSYLTGAWTDCASYARLTLDMAISESESQSYPIAHAAMAMVPAGRGEWDDAEHWSLLARRSTDERALSGQVTPVRYSAALIARARADHPAVLTALGEPPDGGWYPLGGDMCEALRIEALIETGRHDEARAALDRLDRAPTAAVDYQRAFASALRGRLADRSGALSRARHHYETALAVPANRCSALDRALVYLWYGSLLHRTGDGRAATRALSRARSGFADLGATPYLQRCEAELRSAGRQAPDLTDREQQIVRLVGLGLTNREVAADLSVTSKTVEFHLSKIFAKLGISSRRELRPAVATAGRSDR